MQIGSSSLQPILNTSEVNIGKSLANAQEKKDELLVNTRQNLKKAQEESEKLSKEIDVLHKVAFGSLMGGLASGLGFLAGASIVEAAAVELVLLVSFPAACVVGGIITGVTLVKAVNKDDNKKELEQKIGELQSQLDTIKNLEQELLNLENY